MRVLSCLVPESTTALTGMGSVRRLSGLGGGFLDLGSITASISKPAQAGRKFDVAVIGGGSGGLACAKEAALRGASVVLFDHVSIMYVCWEGWLPCVPELESCKQTSLIERLMLSGWANNALHRA
jgi:hypothetical protein